MKQLKSALLMLTVCVMALGACKKDKENVSSAPLSVKVNNTPKTATSTPSAVLMNNTLQILAQLGSSTSLSLMIDNPKVGTFDVSGDNVIATYQANNSAGDGYLGYQGKIIITEYTGSTIKGTFEFEAKDLATDQLITLSDGKFNLKVIQM